MATHIEQLYETGKRRQFVQLTRPDCPKNWHAWEDGVAQERDTFLSWSMLAKRDRGVR